MESKYSLVRIQTLCLAVIATAVLTYMIYWLRPVLIPFVVALFVVSGVTPLLETLEKRLGVNRLIAAAITFLTGLVMIVLLGFCLWLSVLQMTEKGQAYRQRVDAIIVSAQDWLDFDLTSPAVLRPNAITRAEASSKTDSETNRPRESETPIVAEEGGSTTDQTVQQLRTSLDGFLRQGLATLSAELFSLATTSVIVLIYVFFLLLGSVEIRDASSPLREIDGQVRSYLSLKTIISMITGAVFGLTLWLFDVPMSLTFGVLAFLLNYIPNVGPLVATILPIPFIILHPEGTWIWMVSAITATSLIQVFSGNVAEPKLMGDSSGLHPVVILLALMFWGMMWGITGMFLATPITAGIRIVLESFPSTRPVAGLMAGRWARGNFTAAE